MSTRNITRIGLRPITQKDIDEADDFIDDLYYSCSVCNVKLLANKGHKEVFSLSCHLPEHGARVNVHICWSCIQQMNSLHEVFKG